MNKVISSIHFIVSILTLAAVIAEFFLAGLGVFGATSYLLHKATGEAITFASLLLFLLSLAGLLGRTRILLSALFVVLMIIQNLLVHVHNPYIAALHPLNGLAIMGTVAMLVRTVGSKKQQSKVTA